MVSGKLKLTRENFKLLGISFGFVPKFNEVKLVPYHQAGLAYILGKYEEGETFSGTDRMSMAVQPEAIKFLASLEKNAVVLFEGDRLFTASFLEHCVENYDTEILYLETDKDVRQERYKERGSNQNETWLRGRETKIANIMSNMTLMFNVYKFKNNNLQDQQTIVEYIMRTLEVS